MNIRELVDLAIDEDPRAPCLWSAAEHFDEALRCARAQAHVVGAIIYRNKTIRAGEPYSDVTTQRPY